MISPYSLQDNIGSYLAQSGSRLCQGNQAKVLWQPLDTKSNNYTKSYASPLIRKLHPCSDINSKLYKSACLPRWPPFSQHVLWWCCNYPDILSSTAEILLFNLVFHDGVTPVSVSTLKPLLGVIGVLPLKTLSIFYTFCLYIRLVVTL